MLALHGKLFLGLFDSLRLVDMELLLLLPSVGGGENKKEKGAEMEGSENM